MKSKIFPVLLFIAILVLILAGCETTGSNEKAESDLIPPPPPPPLGTYLDFEDIKVPSDLTVDRKGTFVYQAQELRVGVLSLHGRSVVPDVMAFIKESMKIDGWTLLSSFKYQKDILLYTKKNKICLIIAQITRRPDDAELEIWVSPLKAGIFPGQGAQPAPLMGSPYTSPDQVGTETTPQPVMGTQNPVNLFPFGQAGPRQNQPKEETIQEQP
ncbi:MAG: hypothetical protein V1816_26575 [Pseudomonadota bacterium]